MIKIFIFTVLLIFAYLLFLIMFRQVTTPSPIAIHHETSIRPFDEGVHIPDDPRPEPFPSEQKIKKLKKLEQIGT